MAFRLRKSLLVASEVCERVPLHGVHIWSAVPVHRLSSFASRVLDAHPVCTVPWCISHHVHVPLLPRRCKPPLYGETLAAPCIIDGRFSPFQVVARLCTRLLDASSTRSNVAPHFRGADNYFTCFNFVKVWCSTVVGRILFIVIRRHWQ